MKNISSDEMAVIMQHRDFWIGFADRFDLTCYGFDHRGSQYGGVSGSLRTADGKHSFSMPKSVAERIIKEIKAPSK